MLHIGIIVEQHSTPVAAYKRRHGDSILTEDLYCSAHKLKRQAVVGALCIVTRDNYNQAVGPDPDASGDGVTPPFDPNTSSSGNAALLQSNVSSNHTSTTTSSSAQTGNRKVTKRSTPDELRRRGYEKRTLRALPRPPARHPMSGQLNKLDNTSTIPGKAYPVSRLLARRGKPPKLAYLVEWATPVCMLSWQWGSDLVECDDEIDAVNQYLAERASNKIPRSVTLTQWHRGNRRAAASSTGMCFFEAIQACLYGLKRIDLMPSSTWATFTTEYGRDLSAGVQPKDMEAFFRFLLKSGSRINVSSIRPNRLKRSVKTLDQLTTEAQLLEEGWYVVHAGQANTEHCFALEARGSLLEPLVIDAFDANEHPPCIVEALTKLAWIERVRSIRRVELGPITRLLGGRRR